MNNFTIKPFLSILFTLLGCFSLFGQSLPISFDIVKNVEEKKVDIVAKEFQNVAGFQFGIRFDQTDLSYEGMDVPSPEIKAGTILDNQVGNNILVVYVSSNTKGLSLTPGTVVLSYKFADDISDVYFCASDDEIKFEGAIELDGNIFETGLHFSEFCNGPSPCVLVCNDQVNIAIPNSGTITFTETGMQDMFLEGNNCAENDLVLSLYNNQEDFENGISIDNMTFSMEDDGRILLYEIRDVVEQNACWGQVKLYHSLIGAFTAPADREAKCGEDIPVDGVSDAGAPLLYVAKDNSPKGSFGIEDDIEEIGRYNNIEGVITGLSVYVVDEYTDLDNCNLGTLNRKFYLYDAEGNELQVAIQKIKIIPGDDFDASSISFPENITVECDTDPSVTGSPEVEALSCQLAASSYMDEYFDTDEGQKIIRTWTVAEWCSGIIVTHDQIIQSICGDSNTDTEAPIAICLTELSVSLNNNNEAKIWAEDLDAGSHDNIEVVNYLIKRLDDDKYADFILLNSNDVGRVDLVLQVADASGNTNTCWTQINVFDYANAPIGLDIVKNVEEKKVNIVVTEFQNVIGFQFGIRFDKVDLPFEEMEVLDQGINKGTILANQVANNILVSFVSQNTNPISLEPGTVILSFNFTEDIEDVYFCASEDEIIFEGAIEVNGTPTATDIYFNELCDEPSPCFLVCNAEVNISLQENQTFQLDQILHRDLFLESVNTTCPGGKLSISLYDVDGNDISTRTFTDLDNGLIGSYLVLDETSQNSCFGTIYIEVTDNGGLVWPGDTNNDGVVNNFDILNIGIGFETEGASRTDASINWTAQEATDWDKTFYDGLNYKFADADGLGSINISDLEVVEQNWAEEHDYQGEIDQNGFTGSDIPIFFQAGSYETMKLIEIPIHLGVNNLPAENIYGIAFSVSYESSMVDPNSISINTDNSWFTEVDSDILRIERNVGDDGMIHFAMVRKDHKNISGVGVVANLEIFYNEINSEISESMLNIENIRFVDSNGKELPALNISATINIENQTPNAITNANPLNISVYPNPTTGLINIETNSTIEAISLMRLDGSICKTYTGDLKFIDISNMDNQLYLLKIQTTNESIIAKVTLLK